MRALIVDDERLARRELAVLLRAHPEVEVAGEAASVDEALALVERLDPDVLFLDIELPRRSGFELLAARPLRAQVIFVTAHDVHAIRAFEVNALDYLLKPVNPKRLAQTVERLGAPRPEAAAPRPTAALALEDYLYEADGRTARFVRVESIVCIRGADDYSQLHLADGQEVLSSRALKEWEARLPGQHFARVHRTAIVNLGHVERVERGKGEAAHVFLRGLAEPVPFSRRRAQQLKLEERASR